MDELAEMKAGMEAAAQLDEGAVGAVGFSFFDGTIVSLLRKWIGAGLKVGDFWSWLPVILQLIQVVGPKVLEIWKLIMDAINGNKTPAEVLAANPLPG